MELIFRHSEDKPYRPTMNVVICKDDEGHRRAFIVPNLSGEYMTDRDATDLAKEKADKAGYADCIKEVKTVDMETRENREPTE